MTTLGEDVNESLQPVRDAYPDDGTLTALVTALMAPVEIIAQVARDLPDGTPAWQALRDPDRTPAAFLAWLGQHVGEHFTAGDTEADRRDRIRDTPRLRRGKTSVLEAQVARTLTGNKTVRVFERLGGDQWAYRVVTRTEETPDTAATAAAAVFRKPAGLILDVVVTDSPVWDDATLDWAAASGDWDDVSPGDV